MASPLDHTLYAYFSHIWVDIELWVSRRCIRFIKMAMNSDNVVVSTIINMGIGGFQSVMGRNLRLMQSRFKMEERHVVTLWNHKCDNVREPCECRDKCDCTFLDKVECKTIIDFLCTD